MHIDIDKLIKILKDIRLNFNVKSSNDYITNYSIGQLDAVISMLEAVKIAK